MDLTDRDLFLELLRHGHRATLRASGLSMLPAIWPGSTVVLAPPPFSPPLAPGDVLLTLHTDRLRLHRLIAISRPNLYQTKGDSLLRPDPLIDGTQVLGRVVQLNGRDHERPLPRAVDRLRAATSAARWRLARSVARTLRPRVT